jgi:DNA-binding transcriptional ArsR family regulator
MVTDDVFAVIAEATRREILASLRSGDKAVGELVEELAASQPTISKHLKVLREADLVSMRAQGQKRYYALNPKGLAEVANWLETFDVVTKSAASAPAGDSAGAVPAPSAAPATSAAIASAPISGAGGLAAAVSGPAGAAASAAAPGHSVGGQLSPAVVAPAGQAGDDSVPQQIGRTVGRAATKAADLFANLPKFGRKK